MKHNIPYGTLDILFIFPGFQIGRKFSRNQQLTRSQEFRFSAFVMISPKREKFFWIFEIINIDVILSSLKGSEESLILTEKRYFTPLRPSTLSGRRFIQNDNPETFSTEHHYGCVKLKVR